MTLSTLASSSADPSARGRSGWVAGVVTSSALKTALGGSDRQDELVHEEGLCWAVLRGDLFSYAIPFRDLPWPSTDLPSRDLPWPSTDLPVCFPCARPFVSPASPPQHSPASPALARTPSPRISLLR